MDETVKTIVTLVGLGMTLLTFMGIIYSAIDKSQNKVAADLKAHDEENKQFMTESNLNMKESNLITQRSNANMQQTLQELNVEVVKLTSAMANNLAEDSGRDKRAEKRDEILSSLVEATRDQAWQLSDHERRLATIERIEETEYKKIYEE